MVCSGVVRGQGEATPGAGGQGCQRGAKKYKKWALGTKNPRYTTFAPTARFPRYATDGLVSDSAKDAHLRTTPDSPFMSSNGLSPLAYLALLQ